jgi:hypothetical protein
VRKAAGRRVVGRLAGAGALVVGAATLVSLPLIPIWLLAGYRLLKPIPEEMRDACTYRSTSAQDEPPDLLEGQRAGVDYIDARVRTVA